MRKETIAGRETSEDPKVWAVEALDWSGLTGWAMDANGVLEKATRGTLGLSMITGKPISRYATRNLRAPCWIRRSTRLLTYSRRRALSPRATSSGAICIPSASCCLPRISFGCAPFRSGGEGDRRHDGLPEKSN
ncbi:hypothetical protein [Mesorhizobium sp. BHbdii]